MALSDAVERFEEKSLLVKRRNGLCHFATFALRLPAEDQETLASLFKQGVSSRIILQLLSEEGHKVGIERLNDHRYNRCKCETKETK